MTQSDAASAAVKQGFHVCGSACWAAKKDEVAVVMKKRTIDDPKEGRITMMEKTYQVRIDIKTTPELMEGLISDIYSDLRVCDGIEVLTPKDLAYEELEEEK